MTSHHSAQFASALDTPALARHELERWLPTSLDDGERGTLRLLVSELVTNAVRHAGATAPVELDVGIGRERIRIEVHDGGGGFRRATPRPRDAGEGYGGYGLFLVERLASRWGVDTGAGTRVWFELDLGRPAA